MVDPSDSQDDGLVRNSGGPPEDIESTSVAKQEISVTAVPSPPHPTWKMVFKSAGFLALVGLCGWFFNTFLQLRGVVDLMLSRIALLGLWLAMLVIVCLATLSLERMSRLISITGAALILAASMFGLDAWAPKPKPEIARDIATPPDPPIVVAPDTTVPQPPERPAKVVVECRLNDNNSPCELECTTENTGMRAVRDVAVGFVGILPFQTMLAGPAQARITLEKSETLPVPDAAGRIPRDIRAFTVKVPIIPPLSKFSFTLWTDNENNKKACEQNVLITQKRLEILTDLFNKVRETSALDRSKIPDIDLLFSAIHKGDNLYEPQSVLSELGEGGVLFLTSDELQSQKLLQEVYAPLKKSLNYIWQNRDECAAPVFAAEITGGAAINFARFPADIQTYILGAIQMPKEIPEEGSVVEGRPVPPRNYTCEPSKQR